ncbi:MAG: hypothetical protein K2L01_04595 [Rikenellaceae bacterium]|nr:hypothetical protein [Rikenellaceae bacterium]
MKYLSIIRIVLIVISVAIVAIAFLTQGSAPEPNVDAMLRWTYAMVGIATLCAVLLPLINIAKNPKSAVRSLIGVAIVAVIVLIAYALSDATPVYTPGRAEGYTDALELRLSDTGLITTYLALGIAVVSIVVTEVYNLFK